MAKTRHCNAVMICPPLNNAVFPTTIDSGQRPIRVKMAWGGVKSPVEALPEDRHGRLSTGGGVERPHPAPSPDTSARHRPAKVARPGRCVRSTGSTFYNQRTKLIFLKDMSAAHYREDYTKPSSRRSASEISSNEASAVTPRAAAGHSANTLSSADNLTISRYSPNAVSSSEFCSSSSSYYYDDRDYSVTPTTSTTPNQEDDVIGPELESESATPLCSSPESRHETSADPQRPSRDSTSSLLSHRRDKTSAMGGRQEAPCRTTSRTCSNELLNVISIDDDRLRYRHFTQPELRNDGSLVQKQRVSRSVDAVATARRPWKSPAAAVGGRDRLLRALDAAMRISSQPNPAGRVRGAASPPMRSHRPRGQQLPPVGQPTERRNADDLLAPGIFFGLGGDLARMVEKVWNDERSALRRGRLDHELYE